MPMLVHLKPSTPSEKTLAQVAFVGTSCETNAVGKVLLLTPTFRNVTKDKIGLDYPRWPTQVFTIGLFCNENFPKDSFRRLLEYYGFSPAAVLKVDISEGKMHIHTGKRVESLPVKEVSRFARGGCKFCPDFENMCAEISVGNTGSEKGWSTVIVRTERAEKFIQSAAAAGVIELGEASREEVQKEQEKAEKDAIKQKKKTGKGSFLDTIHDETWEKFIDESRRKSFKTLEKDVIDTGLCILCGACATVCPEKNVIIEERPYSLNNCPEECGLCYMACPRTHSFLKVLSREPLATYAARAVRSHRNAQAGGVVTELLLYGITRGFFESVVVTDTIGTEPVSVVTNDAEQIGKSAGSKYVTLPQVLALTKSR
jgi:coenzyme F420 hydrogenase subunit beta